MNNPNTTHTRGFPLRSLWGWLIVTSCVLIILLGLSPSAHRELKQREANSAFSRWQATAESSLQASNYSRSRTRGQDKVTKTAEQIVAAKLTKFAQSRRRHVYDLAERHKVDVPEAVEHFFDAVESGDWEQIEATFRVLNGGDSSAGRAENRPPGVNELWPAIIDAYGAAEQVHDWPAKKLLEYGNTILNSLEPDMVYVGGTDNGRWIPELMNDNGGGEQHVMITQNGLADSTYLDYVRYQYDGRMALPTDEDSKRIFQEYVADAQRRLEHDQQFPDEPKQLRPNEQVKMVDGKVEVGGQVAVMAINEKLLQMILEKNPNLRFAMQESFPLQGTYENASPLGPLMQIGSEAGANPFTAERAAQTSDYWQALAQQVMADPEGSSTSLKSWSHDANSAANLLAAHEYYEQAAETYRLASQIWPGNPEPVSALADLLHSQGQTEQARALLLDFDQRFPDQRSAIQASPGWFLITSPAAH